MSDLDRLRDLALSETGFVFDPYSGATFSLNETGVVVMRALRSGRSREEVLAAMRDAFEVGSADLEHDLDEFVALLRREGLVSRDFEPGSP